MSAWVSNRGCTLLSSGRLRAKGSHLMGSAESRLAASFKTSAATRCFSSAIVPISWPQKLQRMADSSSAPWPRLKLFLPHSAQFSSIRMNPARRQTRDDGSGFYDGIELTYVVPFPDNAIRLAAFPRSSLSASRSSAAISVAMHAAPVSMGLWERRFDDFWLMRRSSRCPKWVEGRH